MKIKILILTLFLGLQVNAQQTKKEQLQQLDALPNSIKNQFDKTYRKAGNWKEFKMIKRTDFVSFQRTVLDSVDKIKDELKTRHSVITEQKNKISSLKNKITDLNKELNEFKVRQSGENNTRLMFFSIIGILALGLIFFLFKFKNSNAVTKKAKTDLAEIEEEFEQHRKNSMEREQKLRRQLQDEINKQRGV